jgi:tryptophan synthase alpha chain
VGEFFPRRGPGRPGLALFLNAGDPPLDQLPDVLRTLDDRGVDCLELAVPFPDSPTDGPVIRRSARRALAGAVGLDEVLAVIAATRPALRHLRIALFADWSYTAKHRPMYEVIRRVADSGADGFLLHGLPPRRRPIYHQIAHDTGLPIVTTCYRTSRPDVVAETAAHATAYLYLVARYGRSGTTAAVDEAQLAGTITTIKALTLVPVAVGFGVRTARDVARVHRLGADAAIVGTGAVDEVERALAEGRDVGEALAALVGRLRPDRQPARRPVPVPVAVPAAVPVPVAGGAA